MRPRPRLRIPRVGLVVDPNGFVLLTDSKNRSAIVAIEAGGERNGGTDIWLEEDPASIDRTGLRLRTLSPVISTEDIPRAASARQLNLAAIATPQVPGARLFGWRPGALQRPGDGGNYRRRRDRGF